MEELKYRFGKYDVDKSGQITLDEFTALYESYSPVSVPKEVIQLLMKKHDKDGSGFISFDEYVIMMNGQPFPK